jgi:hypothetical protein
VRTRRLSTYCPSCRIDARRSALGVADSMGTSLYRLQAAIIDNSDILKN